MIMKPTCKYERAWIGPRGKPVVEGTEFCGRLGAGGWQKDGSE